MIVRFEGRAVYGFADLDELSLAYVLSIHKSQGSSFLRGDSGPTQHYVLQRNLLYTQPRGKEAGDPGRNAEGPGHCHQPRRHAAALYGAPAAAGATCRMMKTN